MSDTEVRMAILDLLRKDTSSIKAKEIYRRLKEKNVSVIDGRSALVHLADEHKVEIASDFSVSLACAAH